MYLFLVLCTEILITRFLLHLGYAIVKVIQDVILLSYLQCVCVFVFACVQMKFKYIVEYKNTSDELDISILILVSVTYVSIVT